MRAQFTGHSRLLLGLITGVMLATGAHAAPGDRLDRRQLGAQVFQDAFQQGLSLDHGCNDPNAKYVDQYCGEGPADGAYPRTHGEHQCYSDPDFDGVNPFMLEAAGDLRITAQLMAPAAEAKCFGAKYTSGMLSTRNSLRMKHGYWEVVAQMPRGGEGRWPAIWLKAGGWPPEIDIAEVANGVLNGSQHSKHHPNGVGSTAPHLGCLCDRPHAFGFLNTGAELIWYVDGVEWYRATPEPGVADAAYYLIVNLAITGRPGGWTGGETPTSVPASLKIYSISAYALASQ